jgi:two-component system, OmpR family, response regulator BaeR
MSDANANANAMTDANANANINANSLIVLVEDDVKIADMLANYLHMHGYRTHTLGDGAVALDWLQAAGTGAGQPEFPALVLLDVMLPGLDGVALCRALRTFSPVPVIMVTARVDELDRLLGLDTGADDYICKPFSPREVVARIKALLRRTEHKMMTGLPREQFFTSQISASTSPAPPPPPPLPPPPRQFTIDAPKLQIAFGGQALNLTAVEFRLFERLLASPGRVLGRAQLLDTVHTDFRDVSDRAVDSHIKNLRRKIDAVHPTLHSSGAGIVSVYGVGYRFTS